MIGARVPIVVVSLGADGAEASVDGRAVQVDGFDVATRSTPPAPATCSSPPGSGATIARDGASTTRCNGRRCTPRSPSGSRPARAARPVSPSSSRKARVAGCRHRRRAASGSPDDGAQRRASVRAAWRGCARGWRARAALASGARAAGCGGGDPAPASRAAPSPPPPPPPPPPCRACRRSATRLRTPRDRARVDAPAASSPGLVRSRSGGFWTHNDSGDSPRIFELGRDGGFGRGRGRRRRERRLGGHRDPRPDALRRRHRRQPRAAAEIAVYRFPEPRPAAVTAAAAERSRCATPTARTTPRRCSSTRATARSPSSPRTSAARRRLHAPRPALKLRRATPQLGVGQAITAGDVSADGRTIVLRSYDRAFVWTRRKASRWPARSSASPASPARTCSPRARARR